MEEMVEKEDEETFVEEHLQAIISAASNGKSPIPYKKI